MYLKDKVLFITDETSPIFLRSALINNLKPEVNSSAAFATIMATSTSGLMTTSAGFAAVVLAVFFQCLGNTDDANAVRTRAFLLSYGYH